MGPVAPRRRRGRGGPAASPPSRRLGARGPRPRARPARECRWRAAGRRTSRPPGQPAARRGPSVLLRVGPMERPLKEAARAAPVLAVVAGAVARVLLVQEAWLGRRLDRDPLAPQRVLEMVLLDLPDATDTELLLEDELLRDDQLLFVDGDDHHAILFPRRLTLVHDLTDGVVLDLNLFAEGVDVELARELLDVRAHRHPADLLGLALGDELLFLEHEGLGERALGGLLSVLGHRQPPRWRWGHARPRTVQQPCLSCARRPV